MSWIKTLNSVLKAHNKAAATGGKAVSFATQDARREILEQGFRELRALGYKLPDVRGFKERHMTALGNAWEAKALSASTIQNRISIFRVFAEWIGKASMIRGSENYVKNLQSVERHQHINFRRTIILNRHEMTFYIDVVTEAYLPKLISKIEREMKNISKKISKKSLIFNDSKNQLLKKISKIKSIDRISRILSLSD